MLTIVLLLTLSGALLLVARLRSRLQPVAAGSPLPLRATGAPGAAPVQPATSASFLPEEFEHDELEAEDLQWLLARQREALLKEERAHLQRESAARLDEAEVQLDSLASRLEQLQGRLEAWRGALLERERLELSLEQLRGDHLDQQYALEALRSENERLRLELAEARKESLLEFEETERLKRQLALLRNLMREGG